MTTPSSAAIALGRRRMALLTRRQRRELARLAARTKWDGMSDRQRADETARRLKTRAKNRSAKTPKTRHDIGNSAESDNTKAAESG